jgi:hypothetical protein
MIWPGRILLFGLCLQFFFATHGQALNELNLTMHSGDYKVNERVLLLLDQDFYLSGEQIHLQGLTYDASLQIPIDFSSVLYLELYTQDYDVIAAKKILLQGGNALNSLTLPRNLPTDYYYLRAYTNFMKNFGCPSFFTKRIKVVNPFLRSAYSGHSYKDSAAINFDIALEGADLISGIDNKVVLFSSDPEDVLNVKLFENENIVEEVVWRRSLDTIHFIPLQTNRYRVEVAFKNSTKKVIPFEKIAQFGTICKLDSVNRNVAYFRLASNSNDDYPYRVFVENGGFTYISDRAVNKASPLFSIKLQTGLNKVVLKNNHNEAVAHRFVFITPEPLFNIRVDVDDRDVAPGDSVRLKINSDINDTIQYLVSLTLGNTKTAPSIQEAIQTAPFSASLSQMSKDFNVSELLGINAAHFNINDYLLLFQKDSQLKVHPENKIWLPELSHDIVSGSISLKDTNLAAVNQDMYLSFVDSVSWLYRCESDSLGQFRCRLPLNHQNDALVISVIDTTETYDIRMESEFYPYFSDLIKEEYIPDAALKDLIEARMINLQINDAFSVKAIREHATRSDLRFYGYPEAEYDFGGYVSLPSLKEFIYEIVEEATPKMRDKKVGIGILTADGKFGTNPLVIFDGIPVRDIQGLLSLPCVQFQSLRIIARQFFFGNQIYDGLIDITSKEVAFDLVESEKNALRMAFPPVDTSSKPFTFPYRERSPFYISNLCSNHIISEADGSGSIEIAIPDNSGAYYLSVFGYTKDGRWSYFEKENALRISE